MTEQTYNRWAFPPGLQVDKPQSLRDALRAPLQPEHQFRENPFLRAAVQDMLKQEDQAKEQMLREHFADTPLALASVLRTGIMPWNIQVQVRELRPKFDEDPYVLRVRRYVRVVEHPRGH